MCASQNVQTLGLTFLAMYALIYRQALFLFHQSEVLEFEEIKMYALTLITKFRFL